MFVSYHFTGCAQIWQGPFSPKEGLRLVQAGGGLVRVSLSGESQGHLRRSLSPKEGLRLVQAGQGLVRGTLSGGKPGASPAVTFPEGRPPPRPSGPGFGPRHPQRGEARGVSGGHFPRRKASASSKRARVWSAAPSAEKARGVSGGHFPRRKASTSSKRARAWSRPCCHRARIFSTSRSVRWKPAVLSGAKSSTFPSRSSWNSRSRDWL